MSRFNFTFILIKKNEHITRIIIKFLNTFREHFYQRISHSSTRTSTNRESRFMAKPRIERIAWE